MKTPEERALPISRLIREHTLDCSGDYSCICSDQEREAREVEWIADAIKAAVAEERERCAKLAESQPFYPDTAVGLRQAWVRNQIAEKIRSQT